jgi:hypothetical protein
MILTKKSVFLLVVVNGSVFVGVEVEVVVLAINVKWILEWKGEEPP